MMVWQDWTSLNKKYNDAWLAGLGGMRGLGAMSSGDIETLQALINAELEARQQPAIVETAVWDKPTCDALTALLTEYTTTPPSQSSMGGWIIDIWNANQQEILAACEAVAGQVQPAPTDPASTPTTTTTTTPATAPVSACTAAGCDCYVYEGDVGPHIEHYQQALNDALVAADYEPIAVTGVWDKPTCGAVFTLHGSFTYDAMTNPFCGHQDFIFPVECPGMVLPTKKPGAKTSRAGMFAIGGLVLAAGLGAAYWVAKR
jgi:hypothetical protein